MIAGAASAAPTSLLLKQMADIGNPFCAINDLFSLRLHIIFQFFYFCFRKTLILRNNTVRYGSLCAVFSPLKHHRHKRLSVFRQYRRVGACQFIDSFHFYTPVYRRQTPAIFQMSSALPFPSVIRNQVFTLFRISMPCPAVLAPDFPHMILLFLNRFCLLLINQL